MFWFFYFSPVTCNLICHFFFGFKSFRKVIIPITCEFVWKIIFISRFFVVLDLTTVYTFVCHVLRSFCVLSLIFFLFSKSHSSFKKLIWIVTSWMKSSWLFQSKESPDPSLKSYRVTIKFIHFFQEWMGALFVVSLGQYS